MFGCRCAWIENLLEDVGEKTCKKKKKKFEFVRIDYWWEHAKF